MLHANIEIARPTAEVFLYVTNHRKWPDWSAPVIAVESAESGPLQPGATVTVVMKLVARQFNTVYQVTAYEPNWLLAYTSESGALPNTITWRFEADPGGGCTVNQTIEGDEELTAGFFKLAFPLIEAAVHRQMVAGLATLKDILESGR